MVSFRPLASVAEVQVASNLADTIYPSALSEPLATFQSMFSVYPQGSLGAFDAAGTMLGYAFYFPFSRDKVFPIGGTLVAQDFGDSAYLHDVAVGTGSRKIGLGRFVAASLLARIAAAGFAHCHGVSVMGSLPFWMSQGFSVVEEISYNGVPAFRVAKAL